jgi:hypothetical protein
MRAFRAEEEFSTTEQFIFVSAMFKESLQLMDLSVYDWLIVKILHTGTPHDISFVNYTGS